MDKDIAKKVPREEFEADWWTITRWMQKIQREQGISVIPDEVFAERLKKLADEKYGTKT